MKKPSLVIFLLTAFFISGCTSIPIQEVQKAPTQIVVAQVPTAAPLELSSPTTTLIPTETSSSTIVPTATDAIISREQIVTEFNEFVSGLNLNLDNVEIPETARIKFPIQENDRGYKLLICVVDEMNFDRYFIAENVEVVASFECWYEKIMEDGSSTQELLLIPLRMIRYEGGIPTEVQTTGFIPKDYYRGAENAEEKYFEALLHEIFGYTGNGSHIAVVLNDPIKTDMPPYGTLGGFAQDELSEIFDDSYLQSFVNGDDINVLLTPDIGLNNSLGNVLDP